ncbi:MAG TPA: hypothetical protein VMH27_15515 [Puia sp.]|nr:hypothetical protein [Puia sp.]
MEERNEISVELSALSALVGGIDRQTPYVVPVGYFDRLPASVMSRIASASSTFQVPEGYFDQFATSVLARLKAGASDPALSDNPVRPIGEGVAEELARLSATLGGISREMPYRLPEGYFDGLSPVLTLLKDNRTYKVPDGYFAELSPVLTVAHDRSTYRAPEGYFAALPERILDRVAEPFAPARVVAIDPGIIEQDDDGREGGRVLKGKWWSYSSAAAAAIAACFLLIFSLPGVDASRESVVTAERSLQNLSDRDLQAYLDDQHAILGESEDQHAMPGESINNGTAALDMNEGAVKSLLAGVSDEDLQQYLDENGKAEDIATN